jgi:hypothetical protein
VVVDYAKSGAKPQISAGGPACTSILPHVSCRFSDDGAGKLTIEAEAPQGFSAPVDLAVCRMVPESAGLDGAAIAGRLKIALADARGSDGQPLQDQKIATRRDTSGAPAGGAGPGSAETAGDEGGAAAGAAGAPGAAPAQGGGGAGTAPSQGMVVTREDLAARERQRAEEQARQRDTQRPIIMPAPGAPSSAGQAAAPDEEPAVNQEGDGSGVNDPTDDDARATEYGIRFDLAAASGPVGALQVEIDYNGGGGGWLGAGGTVACRWMVSASLHACNDNRGGNLKCAVVDTTGFAAPTALMECSFKSRNAVSAGDFSVNVVDASGPDLAPVDARVVVAGVYAR